MENNMIDLRSDTITKPTDEMRKAIASAEVGDDVFGDDPTVIALENKTAEILGKEAALFVPSGTMANQIALRCMTDRGDEVLIHEEAHLYYYESGGAFTLSGVVPRMLKGERMIFTVDDVKSALRPKDVHFAKMSLVCIENTTNRGGGAVWPLENIKQIHDFASENGLKMHLDGARLWNASVASGIPEKEYAKYFDTINVCFSKGLGAPIGSCFVSSRDNVELGRRYRKLLGGGMRQVGIIAAGALYAVENHRERLADDHQNARSFAEGIANLSSVDINLEHVETNILIFRVKSISAQQFADTLYEKGVWVLAIGPDKIRAVTNLGVSSDDIQKAIEITTSVLKSRKGRKSTFSF